MAYYLVRARPKAELLPALEDGLRAALHAHPEVAALGPVLEREVREGRATPTLAARRVLGAFLPGPRT